MRLLLILLLLAGFVSPAAACFGPKLYLGVGASVEEDLLFALVSLYVKEKTGTEIVRVPLQGGDPLTELREERVDLAFLPTDSRFAPVYLTSAGVPPLAAGPRVLTDLQFTTVPAALAKLTRLFTAGHLREMAAEVTGGDSPAAVARRFLSSRGWI